MRLLVYVGLVIVFAGGLFRVEDRAAEAGKAAAVTENNLMATKLLVKQNRADLDAIQADRVARIAARCEQDHQNFLAAQQNFEAVQGTLDLIDRLLHQTDADAIPGLTPDQVDFFRQQRALSDGKLTDARAKLDAARALITQTDCQPSPVG